MATKQFLLETNHTWNGADLPAYPTDKPKISVLKINIPPKGKIDLHQHVIINAFYVAKGTLTVTIVDGPSRECKQGEVICECVNTTHYGENRGDDEVELIVFYVGTNDTPLSIDMTKK